MLAGTVPGNLRLVRLAVRAPTVGDSVILEAKVRPGAARGQETADLLDRKVETLVAIVLAVERVPRIALGRAPHLPRGIGAPSESEYAALGAEGGVRAGKRSRTGVEDPVGIDDEEADPELREHRFDAGRIAALGEPDSFGPAAQLALELPHSRTDLSAPRRRAQAHERQESMGRAARDEPDRARIGHRAKRRRKVPPVALLELVKPGAETLAVVDREGLKPRLVAGPRDLPLRELDQAAHMKGVPFAKERILEHREEGRRERNRDSAGCPALRALLQHGKKWKIGFGESFEEPALLERVLVLGMPDIRKVRVQKNAQVTLRHRASPLRIESFPNPALDIARRSSIRGKARHPRARAREARLAPPASGPTRLPRRKHRPVVQGPTRSEAASRKPRGEQRPARRGIPHRPAGAPGTSAPPPRHRECPRSPGPPARSCLPCARSEFDNAARSFGLAR